MAEATLLLVDSNPTNAKRMETSLRKAGFYVAVSPSGTQALIKLRDQPPDLILADTFTPDIDGFELCRTLKEDAALQHVPFIFLTADASIDSKIRGLELGADDYLTKPIYFKEIVTRIRILLGKRAQESDRRRAARARFAGDLSNMNVVDLVQTFDLGRKSGTVTIHDTNGTVGNLYVRDGRVVDAEVGQLRGEHAVYRLLLWREGHFEIEFGPTDRTDVVNLPPQALLVEGMRRYDEWERLLRKLPQTDTQFVVRHDRLAERLAEIPDHANRLLRLIDGRRTLMQIVDESGAGDLEALDLISRLHAGGLVAPRPPAPPATADRTDAPTAVAVATQPGEHAGARRWAGAPRTPAAALGVPETKAIDQGHLDAVGADARGRSRLRWPALAVMAAALAATALALAVWLAR